MVKATSLSAISGLSALTVAGTQEPVMNIGTVPWRKAASESVSTQVFAAAVDAPCSRARSVYQVRPSTDSGLLISAVQVPPDSVAISPPAPQTKGIAANRLPPATGNGIHS